jgi:peptidoglycan/xylan/chitin deacetylase (PgdA/CDA1 family)
MKQLIPLGALFLSAVACGSDAGEPATPGTGGSASSMAGAPSAGGGGSGGSPSGGGAGMSPSAGSGVGGAAGGQAPTGGAGASSLGGGGSSSGGAAGGMSPGGSGNVGGASGGGNGSGGTGPSASFKCDNLSLAPSKTGVAKPSGAAGGLKVLDWAGFKGAASFTFDDNTPSQMPNYPALKATGGHVTWFVVSNWLNGSADVAKFKATVADGHEVANHTNAHQSSGSANDLQQAQSFIKTNFGVDSHSMAAPNCADAWASVAPNVLFQNRGPCGGGVATISPRDNTSPFRLPAYLPATNEAASKMSAAIQPGKWRIFVLHGFDSQNGTYQPVPIANVTGAMSQAVMDGYWVEGMTNVGAYWQGQKLIPDSATTSAKWTLPDKFPPNMCVRITTSGGTVTQKGETIPWNDHGYYQISLDAGEVTVN